ncbi:hypothetical protein MN869_05560 [Acinetobacter sp. NIPH1876]|uniref:hypothetical protein n=1 Tax=unclassified Acinetobacter TaxID=196816 RepID=UPI001FAD2512|nr:hypothetical protein [Acinetobacter sp. NIPH1876]MCJ0827924.1 hypothetical protein [Acinetobacter sp. NIPH1876]
MFAKYQKRDDNGNHVVLVGTKFPVTYVMDDSHRIFKRTRNNDLVLVNAAEHAKKPWLRPSMVREILDQAAFSLHRANAKQRQHNRWA